MNILYSLAPVLEYVCGANMRKTANTYNENVFRPYFRFTLNPTLNKLYSCQVHAFLVVYEKVGSVKREHLLFPDHKIYAWGHCPHALFLI